MNTNTTSPTPNSKRQHSDAARVYAGNLRDTLEAGGFTLDLRDVAVAYDAGHASAVNSHAALLEFVRDSSCLCEPEDADGDAVTCSRCALLAKVGG